MKLNKKLYVSRVLREYTQKDVADMVGVSVPLISQYEKGKTKPTKEIFLKLAVVYNYDKKYTEKIIKELREKKDLSGMTEEEKKERQKQQIKNACKKYYRKNKKKFHQYYLERKKNGTSRNKE